MTTISPQPWRSTGRCAAPRHGRPAARFRHRADGARSHARLLPHFRLHLRSDRSRAHARLACTSRAGSPICALRRSCSSPASPCTCRESNGKDKLQLTRFLLTRGAWLIVLELTVIAFGLNFALPFVFLQVIWAIGVSMILLAGVIWLPRAAAAIIGVVIVAGHQLLAPIDPADLGALAPCGRWRSNSVRRRSAAASSAYPAIPWFGVMCLGYALGPVFMQEPARRNRSTAHARSRAQLHCSACFAAINAYGDPAPWRRIPARRQP